MTSAAFRVSVQENSLSNHLFTLDIQQNYDRISEASTLYAFVEKLANSLGDRLPHNIVIK